ncbi:hypothetical protein ACJ6WF_15605 [Streptomyces sp. MMS24-I2-30]|uniref:hypothetical protein n=1 Tax=Streptomyces sp. MMS24-I2-30 TaxID=3351564 RepID=UPI003896B779
MVAISDEALIKLLERTPKGKLPQKGDPKVKVNVGGVVEEFHWNSWIYSQTKTGRGRGYSESLTRALKKHDYVPEKYMNWQRLRDVSSVDQGQGQTGNSRGQEESHRQSEPTARVNPGFGSHVGTGAQGHIATPYTAYDQSTVSREVSVFTAYNQSNISTGMPPAAARNPSGHSLDSEFIPWFLRVSNPMGRGRESSRAPGAQEASGGFPGRSGSADASVTPGNQAGTGAQSQAMYPSAIPSLTPPTAHGQGNEYRDPDFVEWIYGMDDPMELLAPPNFGIQGAMGVSDPAYGLESQEFQDVSSDHASGFGNQTGFSTPAFPAQPYGYSGQASISMDCGQYAERDGRNTSFYNSFAGSVWGTQPDLGQAGQVGSVGQSGNYGAGSNAANQPMTAQERAEKEQELARLQAELRQLKGTQGRGEMGGHGNYSQASNGMEYGRPTVGDGRLAVGYGQPAVGYGQSSPDQNPIGNSASQIQPPPSKANSSGTRGGGDRQWRLHEMPEGSLERVDAKLTKLENLVQRPDVQQRLTQLRQQAKPRGRR